MSLAPREQERLTAIENQLRTTDPRFAAMFRMLGGDSHRRKAPVWVSMSVWMGRRGRASVIVVLATIVTLIAAFAAAAAVLA
ncbi:MAG: DUF3040 domain-containing protein [Actinobacteria bacterium]|nr:DUF3040 domain-containing protein [Actinomycetota bacterium]